jgi:hypothetical protein
MDRIVTTMYGIRSEGKQVKLGGLPSLLSNGYHGLFPWGVKRLVREADHSPPSSAEVKE